MAAMQRLAIIDRAEPAMRCISAVAELNRESRELITTIALYMQDTAPWIGREADEAVMLGREASAGADSRLDPARLLTALTAARADALWAGWGLIAEPAELARLCEREGIVVIGPSSDVLRRLGDRAELRQLAEGAGIPVAPWPGGPADERASAATWPRYTEVQVVADGLGTAWAVGVRDASIRQRNQVVIVEIGGAHV